MITFKVNHYLHKTIAYANDKTIKRISITNKAKLTSKVKTLTSVLLCQ